MTNLFWRVADGANLVDYTSKGLNVYLNSSRTNLNIFGNHVFSNEKFAVSEIDSKLERHLRKGFAKLLASGINAAENGTEASETPEEPKQKKKKTTEPEVISQENNETEEIPVPTETPQPQEQKATEEQLVVSETPETPETN